jgi:hypothetical protein
MEYDNLTNLYQFLIPAFDVKLRLIKNDNYHLTKKDIWLYLASTKWSSSTDLTISDMVDDIITVNPLDIIHNNKGETE